MNKRAFFSLRGNAGRGDRAERLFVRLLTNVKVLSQTLEIPGLVVLVMLCADKYNDFQMNAMQHELERNH